MRKIKIGVVGPYDSVDLIQQVAHDYQEKFITIPFKYQEAWEVAEIIPQNTDGPDVWLFSGKVPYIHAVAANATAKPLVYIPHVGSSLYRVLIQIAYVEKLSISDISLDMISHKEIQEAFDDIGQPLHNIYISDRDGIVLPAEMVEFHYNLWKSGKTKAAVTSFTSSYQQLKKLGVQVFRIRPLRDNIRSTLDTAYRAAESSLFKDSQISVQHIVLDDYTAGSGGAKSCYEIRRIEAKLYGLLVGYAEAVRGALNIYGPGHYTLYSTRGSIQETTRQFTVHPLHEEIVRSLPLPVSSGIGFGKTAHEAEENSFKALGFARHLGKGNWMIVSDDGTVVGPLSSGLHLKYSLRVDQQQYRDMAKLLNVSAMTVSRLFAALEKIAAELVGADQLALHLSMTERNARRLLGNLVTHGFAEVSHEETLYKGRPRKLYRLVVANFLQVIEK